MKRTFIQTKEFSRNWDKLGFRDTDLRRLELELVQNPAEKDDLKESEKVKIKRMIELLRKELRRKNYEQYI